MLRKESGGSRGGLTMVTRHLNIGPQISRLMYAMENMHFGRRPSERFTLESRRKDKMEQQELRNMPSTRT
jgi:hypothetical protein